MVTHKPLPALQLSLSCRMFLLSLLSEVPTFNSGRISPKNLYFQITWEIKRPGSIGIPFSHGKNQQELGNSHFLLWGIIPVLCDPFPLFLSKVAFLAAVGIWICSLCSIRHCRKDRKHLWVERVYLLWGWGIKWKKMSKRGALTHCQSCPATLGQGRKDWWKMNMEESEAASESMVGRGARQINEGA